MMVGTDESTEVCGPCFVARVFKWCIGRRHDCAFHPLALDANHSLAKSRTSLMMNRETRSQSYKQFTIVIYDSSVVIWGNFTSGTTLESRKLRS